jgi:hypothetical protein
MWRVLPGFIWRRSETTGGFFEHGCNFTGSVQGREFLDCTKKIFDFQERLFRVVSSLVTGNEVYGGLYIVLDDMYMCVCVRACARACVCVCDVSKNLACS